MEEKENNLEGTNPPLQSYTKFKAWLHQQHPSVHVAYKIALGLAGLIVVIIGLLLVPLPGPGWLVVFLGLAILGLEFPAANRLNKWAKRKVAAGVAWLKQKNIERKKRKEK